MFALDKRKSRKVEVNNQENKTKEIESKKDEASKKLKKRKPGSSPTLLDLHGISVHFPFKPYDCQKDYMSQVIVALQNKQNALLESPTGTGKTLCLLCSALAWQRHANAESKASNREVGTFDTKMKNATAVTTGVPSVESSKKEIQKSVVIYASRTHSQLSQVVSELRSTRYRPNHALLASREQLCSNDQLRKKVSKSSSLSFNNACSQLVKKRGCRFKLNLEGFKLSGSEQPVMDIEELGSILGKKHKVCPFYYTRNSVENADLILMPYNYLFDRDFRKTTSINWRNAVVIFDEGHNLESFASEASSFDLTSTDLGGCILEIQKVINFSSEMSESISLENVVKLKAIFLQLEQSLDALPQIGGSFSGDYIFKFFQEANITYKTHSLLLQFIDTVCGMVMESRGGTSSGTPKLEHFASCVKKVFSGDNEAKCIANSRAYRVHIAEKKTSEFIRKLGQVVKGGERAIHYWCFAPSLAMLDLQDLGIRSIIITSGTLSPMKSYSLELGLKFPVQLENPHIVKKNQIHVRVVGRGVSKKELKSTYDRRNDKEYLLELGNTLCAMAKIIPGGMLVFFPSYGVMDKCIESWGGPTKSPNLSEKRSFFDKRKKTSNQNRFSYPREPNYYGAGNLTPWKRLLSHKAVVLEPKTTTYMKEAIDDFEKFIDQPKGNGCVLMGVTRGKISEGIDFADNRARAVIITGIPFPPLHDPKVKLKREFLDASKAFSGLAPVAAGGFQYKKFSKDSTANNDAISGSEWYSQQAHRAINQAIGRVIRHRLDYGAVILLDSRYADHRNQDNLSAWLRPSILPDEGMGKTISGLVSFFKTAQNDPILCRGRKDVAKANLEYEEEVKSRLDEQSKIREEENQQIPTEIAIVNKADTDFLKKEDIVQMYNIKSSKRQPTNIIRDKYDKKVAALTSVYEETQTRKISKCAFRTYGGQKSLGKRINNAWEINTGTLLSNDVDYKSTKGNALNKNKVLSMTSRKLSMSTDVSTGNGKKSSENARKFLNAMKDVLPSLTLQDAHFYLKEMKSFGDRNDSKSYLSSAKKLLHILLPFDSNGSLLSLLYPLLPSRHRGTVQAMATSARAKQSATAIAAKKSTVNEVLFKESELKLKIKNERVESEKDRRLVPLGRNKDEKRLAVSSTKRNLPSKRALSMISSNTKTTINQDDDPVIQSLRKAESKGFHKTNKVTKIKSNVPDNAICRVCQSKMEKPLLARCGHSACMKCWDRWLSYRPECPVCRKPVDRKNFAHIVFKGNMEKPTLSQICDDSDESSAEDMLANGQNNY